MKATIRTVLFIILVLSACQSERSTPEANFYIEQLPLPHLILKCTVGPVVDQDVSIFSILPRSKTVLAVAEDGLYRASLMDRQWRRLECPDALLVDGYFPHRPQGARVILYNASEGLFVSNDDGLTWHLVSNEYQFGLVLLHRNGTLYATANVRIEISEPITNVVDLPWCTIEPDGNKHCTRAVLLMSKDGGQSWKDITGNIGAGIDLMGISEDPDHPDSVILYGVGERGYILQASNENYNWKLIRQEKWTREHKETEEQFFARSYSSGTTLYNFGATLANYFDYDFGTSVVLPALDIVPEQTSYEFTQIGNKTIQVTVRFLRNYADEPVVRLVDISAPEVWAIRVRTPAGERIYSPSASSQFVSNSENREKARQVYRAQQDLQAVEVSKTHPYTRMIDLDSLFAFSQVGVYKVQLLYENNDIAERDRDEWIGLFSSQPFTVTITPQG